MVVWGHNVFCIFGFVCLTSEAVDVTKFPVYIMLLLLAADIFACAAIYNNEMTHAQNC